MKPPANDTYVIAGTSWAVKKLSDKLEPSTHMIPQLGTPPSIIRPDWQ